MTGTIIASVLVNSASIAAVVGDRIYPVAIPQTKELPALVYYLTANEPGEHNDRPPDMDRRSFTVTVVAKSYSQCDQLAELVRKAMEAHRDTQVQNIYYQSEGDDFEPDLMVYIRNIDFIARIRRIA